MNDVKLLAGLTGTTISGTGIATATTQWEQYISIILTIVGFLITIITTIIIPVIKHFQEAKKDGKITPDEIEEGVKIIENGIENLKDKDSKK